MQLGEGQLDGTPSNLPKALYHSSEESNKNSLSSTQIDFQGVNRPASQLKHGAKKLLSETENDEMLGEGHSDALSLSKGSSEDRKSSLATEEEDPSDNSRHTIDGISPDRYFISASSHQTQDMNPCSLFPYPGQAGTIYTGSDGARYSASLHYNPVLPSTGFSSPVCSGRGQCGSGYQFGQGPGCIYPSYQGSGPGISSMPLSGAGTGLRSQVYLCNRPLWLKFHRHQTEMIITKQGRFVEFVLSYARLLKTFCFFNELLMNLKGAQKNVSTIPSTVTPVASENKPSLNAIY